MRSLLLFFLIFAVAVASQLGGEDLVKQTRYKRGWFDKLKGGIVTPTSSSQQAQLPSGNIRHKRGFFEKLKKGIATPPSSSQTPHLIPAPSENIRHKRNHKHIDLSGITPERIRDALKKAMHERSNSKTGEKH